MESEIFGHVKGAFTGAASERKGAAIQADGGTFFLDEICEMDMDLQSKLLRFIQTGQFQKVGGSKVEEVDVRFICATNRNPLDEVKAGRFREDLFYRLHVIPIQLPALRERDNDILLIADKFLTAYSAEEHKNFIGMTPECEAIFMSYSWPGNIRELQNVIRNIVVLNNEPLIQKNILPPPLNSLGAIGDSNVVISNQQLSQHEVTEGEVIPLWQVEKQTIQRAISYCDGNIPQAAALLEVSPSTIYRKKQAW